MLSEKSNYQLLKMSNIYQNELRLDRNASYWENINDKIKEFLLQKGDSVLTLTGTVGKKDFGYSVMIDDDDKYLLNQRLVLLREKKGKSINGYINQILLSERFLFYFFAEAKGGTGNQTNVGIDDIKNIQLYFPIILEQQKISSFFALINKRIITQKKIIEDLVILKSNTAQNIFNQVFKFKDSEENDFPNWEIKKLGDVCEIKRGASPRPISDSKWFDENSPIGWVRISDVTKSNKYLDKTEQYLSNAGMSKSRLVKKGNIIMSICATIGKPIYTNFDVCIHDGFVVFENLTLDKEFLYYYLDFIQLNWYKYGQSGTQVNLNSEIVNNESIVVPVIEEQIKIAEFLSKLDAKINLETELLNQYENQKKYLLQNLFV